MMSRYILVIIGVLAVVSCQKSKYDMVEDTHEQSYEGASPEIDYEKVSGIFKGKYKGKEAVLQLNNDSSYTLEYDNETFKGKYFRVFDNSMIDLEYMEYQDALPFHLLAIEDVSLLTIHEPEEEMNQYFLEKIKS